MTTATFTPAATPTQHGAQATGAAPAHPVGGALQAVKVFFGAVFSVAVLGEYGEEAGVRRH
ncbi:hypothetical protein ACFVIM_11220 [Streptomyces sp. NPDC057638]|uniref:hypothetical protein n=1 Tax=Streptomyces sp. NPDC057638 TaxID=3346190 RepID=UPI00369B0E64